MIEELGAAKEILKKPSNDSIRFHDELSTLKDLDTRIADGIREKTSKTFFSKNEVF